MDIHVLMPVECQDVQMESFSYLYENNCQNCPENNTCPYNVKQDCPLNYYSAAGSTNCLPCPNGKSCMRSNPVTVCAAGQYSLPSTYLCVNCPPGYACADGISAVACTAGTFSPTEGQTSCTACQTGFYSPPAAAICTSCPGGFSCADAVTITRCLPGMYSVAGSGVCQPGISGFIYLPFTDEALPPITIAPKGMYSTQLASGQVAVYKCPAGKYGPTLGATSVSQCITCPAGFYCPIGTGNPLLYECPQGNYCPAGSTVPTACSNGTYLYQKRSYCSRHVSTMRTRIVIYSLIF